MRRYVRPLALTALFLISWLSVAPHAMAQSASSYSGRKTTGVRDREVTSVVESPSALIINTSGQSALPPPAVRFYPGDNGEAVMVADFVGLNFGQASRIIYPTGGGIQKVRIAQVQDRPAIFRLVLSAPSMRVFKRVEFASSSSGTLTVKLPSAGFDTGNGMVPRLTPVGAIAAAPPTMSSTSTIPRFAPQRASVANGSIPTVPVQRTASVTTGNNRSSLPPMPSGGLLLDLQVDGQALPAPAPQAASVSRITTAAAGQAKVEVKKLVDPNKPVLRGPIAEPASASPSLVHVAPSVPPSASSVSPGSRKGTATNSSSTVPPTAASPALSTAPADKRRSAKIEKPQLETEVVEVVAEADPPMLPGLSSVKKTVQISSASKFPQSAPNMRTGGAQISGGTARGALTMTKALAGNGAKSDFLPPPPPPSVALSAQEKVVSEEEGANIADQAPDIVSSSEIKVVSVVPLRLAVSSSSGKLPKTKTFRLHDPERHVIDIESAADLSSATMPEIPENAFVKTIRLGSPDGACGRIVLDLNSEDIQVCERCDENGLLIIDIAKEMPTAFNPAAHLPGGSVIVIDAGHGGTDPGAQRGDIQEKEITLAICEKLRKLLRRQGARVVMTRSDDTFVSLEERVRITNETAPSAFVSVHINSLESNNSITGIETYYLHPQSRPLAESIHSSLVGKLAVPDRNVRTARFYVVNHTPYPAILAEVGFISNKDERDKLISSDYQQKIAEALAQGVIVYVATHGTNPGASIASATAAGMSSVKQAARSSQTADASGTRTSQAASQSKKGKRFTQILHAKKPAGREKPTKIAMNRRKAKKSNKRIAIAHRSLRSNRSR